MQNRFLCPATPAFVRVHSTQADNTIITLEIRGYIVEKQSEGGGLQGKIQGPRVLSETFRLSMGVGYDQVAEWKKG